MSAPPPPPPRRARGPVEPEPSDTDTPAAPPDPATASPDPATASPDPATASAPPPPPRRRASADAESGDQWSTLDAPTASAATATAVAMPAGATRAERRATAPSGGNGGSSDGRGRRRVIIVAAVVVVLLLAVGGAFAAGVLPGGGGGSSGPPEASTNVKLERGDERVRWPGLGPGQFDRGVADQLMKGIGVYVDQGVVPGLRTGKVQTTDLAAAFDEGAIAQLNGEARGTLLDEGLPKAIGKLTITAPPIEITELNDASNKPVLASAKLDLDVRAQSAKGFYEVKHEGELVFAPDASGAWKVTGWDVKVLRSPPSAKAPWITTTTAAKSAGKGT